MHTAANALGFLLLALDMYCSVQEMVADFSVISMIIQCWFRYDIIHRH